MSFNSASMAMFGLFSTSSWSGCGGLSTDHKHKPNAAAAYREAARREATVKHQLAVCFELCQDLWEADSSALG